MNTAQPIRDQQDLEKFTNYYRNEEKKTRNQLLIVMGLNTALRISDILSLQWKHVYDVENGAFRGHLLLTEAKTGKNTCILMNRSILQVLSDYLDELQSQNNFVLDENAYLFKGMGEQPISRVQAYRIVRKAAENCKISGTISPHSLRKTFGYYAWKKGTPPVLLMEIYHHSSFKITQRYLGIEQDDRDEVFKNICL